MPLRALAQRLCLQVLTFVLAMVVGPVYGQQPQAFDRLSTPEGLASHAVTALLQEPRGFLWVGTMNGLYRFDGIQFTRYPRGEERLTDEQVNVGALHVAAGGLWIGTRNGLNRLDLATGEVLQFFKAPLGSSFSTQGIINALTSPDERYLWVATYNGLFRLNLTTYEQRVYTIEERVSVLSLFPDPSGTLWAGSTNGLYRYSPESDQFVAVTIEAPATTEHITAIHRGSDGMLYLGLRGGAVIRFNDAAGESKRIRPQPGNATAYYEESIMSIAQDSIGTLWVGIWGGGLCAYTQESQDWACTKHLLGDRSSLSDNQVSDLLVDRSGNLFVATWNGLNILRKTKPFRHYRYKSRDASFQISHPRVNAMFEDSKGDLWLGLYGGGLEHHDRASGQRNVFRHDPADPTSLSSDEVWSIAEDRRGDLWIATGGGGISRLNRRNNQFKRYLPRPSKGGQPITYIYSVFVDRSGGIWSGTVTHGLLRYMPESDSFQDYLSIAPDKQGIAHYSVWPLLEDSVGGFWFGTVGGGVQRMDRETDLFERVPAVSEIPLRMQRLKVVALTMANDGAIWASTTGDGAVRIEPETGDIRYVLTQDTLLSSTVMCMLPGDEGDMWIASSLGLSRYDGEKKEVVATYTVNDGLPRESFLDAACLRTRDGELLFGSNDGMTAFFPGQIRDNPQAPVMAVTGVDVFGVPTSFEPSLTRQPPLQFTHRENELTFHFAALEFSSPTDQRYEYWLEGVDQSWEPTSERFVRYPNLAPGTYTFRVRGTNNDGLWSLEYAEISFEITPSFVQRSDVRWGSLAGLFVLLGLAIWVIARFRLKNALRIAHYEQRVQTEQEVVRRRLLRELHDDIGGDLGGVVYHLERLGRAEHLGEGDRQHLVDLWQRVRRVFDYVRDATWVVETKNDTLQGLVDRLHNLVYAFFPDGQARFEAPDVLPEMPVPMEKRQHLFLLCKEALHNILKHAGAAEVALGIHIEAGVLTIGIRDNGRGFDLSDHGQGYGLTHMKERAEAIGALLDIRSTPGIGTELTLVVPVTRSSPR